MDKLTSEQLEYLRYRQQLLKYFDRLCTYEVSHLRIIIHCSSMRVVCLLTKPFSYFCISEHLLSMYILSLLNFIAHFPSHYSLHLVLVLPSGHVSAMFKGILLSPVYNTSPYHYFHNLSNLFCFTFTFGLMS
jgi:ABC-type proline/glycine betaine transport system permease subunit